MALEINPSAKSFLVAVGVVLILVLWLLSSGAFTTLIFLALAIGVFLLLLWASGVRVSKYLTGAQR